MANTRNRKLGFQSLEDRSLMAGDVTTRIVDGNLYVQGSEADNQLTVTQLAEGTFKISGQNTTINHQGNSFIATGITGDVVFRLGAGNDSLNLSGMTISGALGVYMGGGKDVLNLTDLDVKGGTEIATRPDPSFFSYARVGRIINRAPAPQPIGFMIPLMISTHPGTPATPKPDGADTITISNCKFGETIDTYVPVPGVYVDRSPPFLTGKPSLSIETGESDDLVTITQVTTVAAMSVYTLGGKDTVNISNEHSQGLLTVNLGDGNDRLGVTDIVASRTFFDGGLGSNTLDQSAASLGPSTIVNFVDGQPGDSAQTGNEVAGTFRGTRVLSRR